MSESADIRNLWLTVAVYVVIFAAKIAAYLASGVMAPNITVDEGARIAAEVRARVHEQTRSGYCFIETDPAPEPPAEDTVASMRVIAS